MDKATKTAKRIDYLRALIDHPRTGEAEREAAKRALQRVLGAQARDKGQDPKDEASKPSWWRERVYGAKFTPGYETAAQIAAKVRADIRLALKIARAEAKDGEVAIPDPLAAMPKEIKVTVKCDTFSGGRSVDVIMRNIPEEWGFSMQADPYWPSDKREMPTPELRAAAKALKAILSAYNYDGSAPEVDYYDVNFYGHVQTSMGLLLA